MLSTQKALANEPTPRVRGKETELMPVPSSRGANPACAGKRLKRSLGYDVLAAPFSDFI